MIKPAGQNKLSTGMAGDGNIPYEKKCDIGDAEIRYLHYPCDGPDLILLHATGFLPWLWHPVAEKLSAKYNVIVPYFCDHRDAEPEDGGISWAVLAEDLSRLCSSLDLKTPFVAGHSMGGTVITLCAGMHTITPRGMILIEPIYLPKEAYKIKMTVKQHPLASKSIKRKSRWSSLSEAESYLASRKLFEKWDRVVLDLYIRHGMKADGDGGLALSCSPRKEASLFMGGIAKDPWPMLPGITCPVLLVEGGESENRRYIDLKYAASLLPRGSHTEVPGAGHLVPMEQPDAVYKIISDFFDKIRS